MSRMRRTIAKRLVSAKNNTAMLTTFNEVDLTEVMALREKHQDAFVKKYGIKLGFMSIFAKACAKVLLKMPEVNAMIDGDDRWRYRAGAVYERGEVNWYTQVRWLMAQHWLVLIPGILFAVLLLGRVWLSALSSQEQRRLGELQALPGDAG